MGDSTMHRVRYTTLALIAGALLMPQGAVAQSGDGWWEWALDEVAELRSDDGRRAVADARREGRTIGDVIFGRDEARSQRGARADRKGPPFCRNGQGHPVHGRQWCRDKGFGLGSGSARWEDRGWEDIILGSPRRGDRRQRTMDQGGLIDVLGDVVLGRLDGERRRLGGRAALEGRWLDLRQGGRVLQIRSGNVPVAELSDLDGDGRVDVTLVPRQR